MSQVDGTLEQAPRGRAKLLDVAARAGVSRATASLVLRESPLVADETRQRVLFAMAALGYVQHRGAASLRTRRSHTIGLVIPDLMHSFFAEVAKGVARRLEPHGYQIVISNSDENIEADMVAGAAEGADGHMLDEADVWFLADAIPEGTSAAVALIEHRWAIPLRDKIIAADGVVLADEWVHPADLVAIGLHAAEAAS